MDSELLPHAQTLLLSRQLVERDKNAKNLQLWQCRTAWMAHLDPGHDLPDMRNDTERLLGARLHMQMLSMRAWRVFERGDARHNVPPRTIHVGEIVDPAVACTHDDPSWCDERCARALFVHGDAL
jgi:hypothetical protein